MKPEDGNWLMIRRTYDGWGYSPLDQITPANVARLRPVWGSTTVNVRQAFGVGHRQLRSGNEPGVFRGPATAAGVGAPPTSFSVNGKQYIAVLAGWGQDAGGEVHTMALFPGEVPTMPDGGSVWVFALE